MSTMQRPPDEVAPGSAPAGEGGLDRTEIYDVLSNERRTMVLELLAAAEPRDLGDLAELIAAEETGERPPPRKKRTSVYVTLHQTHLPKLAELSIVEYDDREKVVSLGTRASAVLAERGPAPDRTPAAATWSRLYLGLVATGLALAGGSAVGLPGFQLLSAGTYAVATLVVLLAILAFRVGQAASVERFVPSLLQ